MVIKETYSKAINFCKIAMLNIKYSITRYTKNRDLKSHNTDLILFYLPNREQFNGGILSLFFFIEQTQKIRPNSVVLPVVITTLQRYFKLTWFKNPFFIYNVLCLKSKIRTANNLLIHVPECLFAPFCDKIKRHHLEGITKNCVVNILNQNAEAMPSNDVFYSNKHLFSKLTMTLAFKVNLNIDYPFLDQKPQYLGAWLYGDDLKYVDFEDKRDICIISPDPHPLKLQVIDKIEKSGLARCIEIRNIPFDDYRALRLTSKWAISFGEGYDGYFGGVIIEGGVGLCVDNQTFSSPFIDPANLPYNVFTSYEQMLEEIVDRMRLFEQDKAFRTEIIGLQRKKALEANSPDMVIDNLKQYYQSIRF